MSSKWPLSVGLCSAAALSVAWLGHLHEQRARRDLLAVLRMEENLNADIHTYESYLAQRENTLFNVVPQAHFEERIGRIIQSMNIRPAPRYTIQVQAENETNRIATSESGVISQRASVSIPNLTPKQVGVFLVSWHEDESVWIPVSISLIHSGRSDQNNYTLSMECVAKHRK